MGSTVKQLAVIAISTYIAIQTGQAQFLVTALGTSGAAALGALAGAIAGAVAGKALGIGKSNLDDSQPISDYSVSSLQNKTNNNNVVPTVYGENRIGGTREFADLQSGNNNNLYEIITFASHEINAFVDMFANNESMTQGTGGDTDKYRFASDKILVKVYTVKATPLKAITAYSGGVWTEADLSSLTFQNGTFVDTDIPDGIAFAVVHHIYDTTNNNQRKEITSHIQGKKIRPINSISEIGTTPIYSNNPAEIELDFLTDSKNFNVEDSKIDIESFYTSKLLNVEYGFTCNIAFGTATNLSAAIQEIKATNRSNLIYSQGLWKVKQDEKNKEISFTITASDIISGSFSWSQKKARDIANITQVSYIEPSDQWQTKLSAEFKDDGLIESDGREYKKTISLRGVTNSAQADIISELALNQFRYTEDEEGERIKVTPLTISFTTTIKNAALEVGDMGTIDYYELPRPKNFVIVAISTKQSGELTVSAEEYANTHYKDSDGNFII